MNYEQLSDDQRREFTRAVMSFLDTWKLSSEQTVKLLNLPDSVRTRHLAHFRSGMKALPEGKDVWSKRSEASRISGCLVCDDDPR